MLYIDMNNYFKNEHKYNLSESENVKIIFYTKKTCSLCVYNLNEIWEKKNRNNKYDLIYLVTDTLIQNNGFNRIFIDENSSFLNYPIKMDYICEYEITKGKIVNYKSLIR